jgi:hypothetical protein
VTLEVLTVGQHKFVSQSIWIVSRALFFVVIDGSLQLSFEVVHYWLERDGGSDPKICVW